MDERALVFGLLWFIAFLFSTTVHEALHAFVAYRGGDRTAYLGGQVSLSPLPHIRREPIGMLVVPLLTAFTNGWALGWASTPYDPMWAARHPRRAASMAAAGPAGNLLIAGVAFGLLRIGIVTGVFVSPDRVNAHHMVEPARGNALLSSTGDLLSVLLVLNVLLFVFNMLPLPPLDGGSAISGVLPERLAPAIRAAAGKPAVSMLGLLVAWQAFPAIAWPIVKALIWLVHPADRYDFD
jgi:Zn-dependent protease